MKLSLSIRGLVIVVNKDDRMEFRNILKMVRDMKKKKNKLLEEIGKISEGFDFG